MQDKTYQARVAALSLAQCNTVVTLLRAHGQEEQADNMEAATSTSYTYQNVGLTAELRAKVLSETQVVLRGDIEVSAAKESTGTHAGAAPTIGTFDQRFNVLLDDGKPLELAQVSNPEGGTVSIRVEANLMK